MPWIETDLLQPDHSYLPLGKKLPSEQQHQTYCGLDCCLTWEIRKELEKQPLPAIYSFERALQGPYMDIMRKGFLVDSFYRRQISAELKLRKVKLELLLNDFAMEIWDKGLNSNSPLQLKNFFYSALRIPEIQISKKGIKKVSVDREALEKLHSYLHARPFVNCILAIRDLGKQISVFETEIENNRFHTSYNIAGTETGRPSSSKNAYGTGGNAQNIALSQRYVFIADPGWKLCVIDLEQVEARDVGFFCGCLFDDWTFLDNCESGDLHTNNAKLVWPQLAWKGSPAEDRKVADQTFYREFTYRDMAKRGGHLTNYYGTPWTMAKALKIPQSVAEEFQARYCKGSPGITPAFPAIPRWWRWTAEQLQTKGFLINPFGRKRHFFSRPGDDATLREAIANLPQSTTADRTNLVLWKIWKNIPQIQLLAQTYDSVTFQFPSYLSEEEIISKALKLVEVELFSPSGRSYIVPGEAKVGWNWGSRITEEDREKALSFGREPQKLNLDGLVKWKIGTPDRRKRSGFLQKTF